MFIAPQDETPFPLHSQANLMWNTAGLFKFQRAPLPVSGQASVSMSCYFLAFAVLAGTGGWPWPQSVNATPELGATMDMAGNGAAVWEKSLTGG
jgi:hypothetical protein